jgi:TraM recognition site of TraD and TraG
MKLDNLQELATQARSKGVAIFLATQSIENLNDQYGESATNAIMGQMRHKAILALDDEATAEYASKQLGEAEESRAEGSYAQASDFGKLLGHGNKTSYQTSRQVIRRVLPSQLMAGYDGGIPLVDASIGQGLTGYYIAPHATNIIRHYIPWNTLTQQLPTPRYDVPDYLEAPVAHQHLRPWDEGDRARLGIEEIWNALQQSSSPAPSLPVSNGIDPLLDANKVQSILDELAAQYAPQNQPSSQQGMES